ncbi:MAG: hypothetical protein D6712_16240 [Chloroflexi bacterium]|nr:MAG: hypothetical protein D6712_16240 [Chloroflexota bacterium]
MYYIIETDYIGPSDDLVVHEDTIVVTTTPPRTNMSNEIRTEGWLGSTNDVARYAHGAFDNLDDAQSMVWYLCKHVGWREAEVDAAEKYDGVVYKVFVGENERATPAYTREYFYDAICQFVKAHTTDEEIEKQAKDWIADEISRYNVLHEVEVLIQEMKTYRDTEFEQ